MPNSWTDITAEIDSIAELKVVEYILRHSWGYQEYGIKKHITIDEFVNGRRRQDGSRMDRGTGLSERAVYDGLRKAVENGLIEEEIDDSDRGRVKKFYSLRMREGAAEEATPQSLRSGVQTLHPPLQRLHPDPQSLQPGGAPIAPRTEKDTLERHFDTSKFERSDDRFEEPTRRPTNRQGRVRDDQGADGRGHGRSGAGYATVGELIERRRRAQVSAAPRRKGRPPGTGEEREQVTAYLADFAVELGDEAPLSSTVSRALKILKAAGVPAERWGDLLYQARALTKEHSAQIRKKPSDPGRAFPAKVRMPYYLAVLEDLVGLPGDPDERAPTAR